MIFPGFVLAYHGCDRAVGEKILTGTEHVRSSTNEHDWLGYGAYFWEGSPQKALEWGHSVAQNPCLAANPIHDPFVLGAIIRPINCLDLLDAASLNLLRDTYRLFKETAELAGVLLPQNEKGHSRDEDLVKRYLDCAVLNYLHLNRQEEGLPPFDTVRGAFMEGGPLYPGAGLSEKTHIQWCVREPRKSVRGYFRLLPEWDGEE